LDDDAVVGSLKELKGLKLEGNNFTTPIPPAVQVRRFTVLNICSPLMEDIYNIV